MFSVLILVLFNPRNTLYRKVLYILWIEFIFSRKGIDIIPAHYLNVPKKPKKERHHIIPIGYEICPSIVVGWTAEFAQKHIGNIAWGIVYDFQNKKLYINHTRYMLLSSSVHKRLHHYINEKINQLLGCTFQNLFVDESYDIPGNSKYLVRSLKNLQKKSSHHHLSYYTRLHDWDYFVSRNVLNSKKCRKEKQEYVRKLMKFKKSMKHKIQYLPLDTLAKENLKPWFRSKDRINHVYSLWEIKHYISSGRPIIINTTTGRISRWNKYVSCVMHYRALGNFNTVEEILLPVIEYDHQKHGPFSN